VRKLIGDLAWRLTLIAADFRGESIVECYKMIAAGLRAKAMINVARRLSAVSYAIIITFRVRAGDQRSGVVSTSLPARFRNRKTISVIGRPRRSFFLSCCVKIDNKFVNDKGRAGGQAALFYC